MRFFQNFSEIVKITFPWLLLGADRFVLLVPQIQNATFGGDN